MKTFNAILITSLDGTIQWVNPAFTSLTGYTFGLVVPADSPIKSIKDLVAYAKANPGKFTYGVGGIGGQPHLSAASILAVSGIKALHVPFKTQNDVAFALLRGDVDFTILATTTSLPLVQTGKFRPSDLDRGITPAHVIPTVADVRGLIGLG